MLKDPKWQRPTQSLDRIFSENAPTCAFCYHARMRYLNVPNNEEQWRCDKHKSPITPAYSCAAFEGP